MILTVYCRHLPTINRQKSGDYLLTKNHKGHTLPCLRVCYGAHLNGTHLRQIQVHNVKMENMWRFGLIFGMQTPYVKYID